MGDVIDISGDAQGYLALPAAGHGPGVVVIQEWWGLVPHIREVVDRFATAGFVALAPDHYRGATTTEPDEAQKLMLGLRVAQAAADIAQAAAYLVARDDVDGDAVGVVGFCMGGGLALLAPTVSDQVDCTAAFYPAMPWPDYAPDWSRYRGKEALIHKAESDEGHAGPRIAAYVDEIRAHGGIAVTEDYPGSMHAFFNDQRPEVHSPEHSATAWDRTLALFRRRLG